MDSAAYCAECGAEVVSPLSNGPEGGAPADQLAILATFGDSVEASILLGRLEQAGIEACIPEELDSSPFGNFKPLSQVTVRVAEKDLVAAKEILAAAPETNP
jgi:hypothetical protein